jgi:predicted component of viral defense system (DUF524 family)
MGEKLENDEIIEVKLWKEYFIATDIRKGLPPCIDEESKKLYLFEWTPYFIVGDKPFTIQVLNHKIYSSRLRDQYVAELQFNNHIGVGKITIIENNDEGAEILTEVLSMKVLNILGASFSSFNCKDIAAVLETHNRFYKALFQEILKISSSLPFSVSSPTGFASEEGEEPVNELFAYHYFINMREPILEAFETVLRKSNKKLIIKKEWHCSGCRT